MYIHNRSFILSRKIFRAVSSDRQFTVSMFFLTDYLPRGIVYDEHPSASFPVQKGIAPPLRLGGGLVRDDTAFRVLPAPAPPGISVADVQYLSGTQAEACEMEVVCHPGYVSVLVIVVSPELCRKDGIDHVLLGSGLCR